MRSKYSLLLLVLLISINLISANILVFDDTEDAVSSNISEFTLNQVDHSYDEDWLTDADHTRSGSEAGTFDNSVHIYENYTIPPPTHNNFNITSRFYTRGDVGCQVYAYVYCYNSTDWDLIFTQSAGSPVLQNNTYDINISCLDNDDNVLQIQTQLRERDPSANPAICGLSETLEVRYIESAIMADYDYIINSEVYNSTTYETETEFFTINLTTNYELSNPQLVYNGTNFSVSNISIDGNITILSVSIDIPINSDPFANETKNVFWRFDLFDGSSTSSYETLVFNQNVSFINLQICNSTYNTPSLNFTMKDELTFNNINPAANATSLQSNFYYWLGSGSTYKNYSYEVSNDTSKFQFDYCLYPVHETIKCNMDMLYSAIDYDERSHVFRNSSLTNVTSLLDLLLLSDDETTKFTIDVKQGVSNFNDATVTISKYFVGNGTYRTVSIRQTNSDGEFIEYLDLDSTYRFQVVKDGVLYATVEKQALCAATPCELSINIDDDQGSVWSAYNNYFASNVVSSMSWNETSEILTYSFLDTTGLAQYFRLTVERTYYNETVQTICDDYLYSTSGSLTCNVSGNHGDFVAKGRISRSPEIIDQVKSFVISELKEDFGLLAIFISFAIILTVTIAFAVTSRGNPTTTIIGFGLSILIVKLMTLFPFSWVIVALIELVVIVLAKEIGT